MRTVFARLSASLYLKRLAEVGVVEEQKVGREKLFVNTGLMEILAALPD